MWQWVTEHISIDPVSFPVALIALVIALREMRRNSHPILRLLKCDSRIHTDRTNPRDPSTQLRVAIRNDGVTLHRVSLHLKWRLKDMSSYSLQLPLAENSEAQQETGTFAPGMIAEFEFDSKRYFAKTPQLASYTIPWPEDPKAAQMALVVEAQGSEAARFRVDDYRQRNLKRWNKIARILNRLTRRDQGNPLLPYTKTRESTFRFLASEIAMDSQKRKEKSPPTV